MKRHHSDLQSGDKDLRAPAAKLRADSDVSSSSHTASASSSSSSPSERSAFLLSTPPPSSALPISQSGVLPTLTNEELKRSQWFQDHNLSQLKSLVAEFHLSVAKPKNKIDYVRALVTFFQLCPSAEISALQSRPNRKAAATRAVFEEWNVNKAEEECKLLRDYATLTYKPSKSAPSQLSLLLQELPLRQAKLKQGIVLAIVGENGSGKTFILNEVILRGWTPVYERKVSNEGEQPPFIPGKDGPLVSANDKGSVTKLPARIRYEAGADIRVAICDSNGIVKHSEVYTGFTVESMRKAQVAVTAFVENTQTIGTGQQSVHSPDWEIQIYGPFPGLAQLQLRVSSAAKNPTGLVTSIEFVDLPGFQDAEQRHRFRRWLPHVDVLLFRPQARGYRGFSAADVVRLAEHGAFSEFSTRCTLVLTVNAFQDGQRDIQDYAGNFRDELRHMREGFAKYVLAAPHDTEPMTDDENKSVVEELSEMMTEAGPIHVQSKVEGQKLLEKAEKESRVLIFHSLSEEVSAGITSKAGEADLGTSAELLDQMSGILVVEACFKLKQRRIHPTLEVLIRVAKELKTRVARRFLTDDVAGKTLLKTFKQMFITNAKSESPLSSVTRFTTKAFDHDQLTSIITSFSLDDGLCNTSEAIAARLSEGVAQTKLLEWVKDFVLRQILWYCEICDNAINHLSAHPRTAAGADTEPFGFVRTVPQVILTNMIDNFFDLKQAFVINGPKSFTVRWEDLANSVAAEVKRSAKHQAPTEDSDEWEEVDTEIAVVMQHMDYLLNKRICDTSLRKSVILKILKHLQEQCIESYHVALKEYVYDDASTSTKKLSIADANDLTYKLENRIHELQKAIRELNPHFEVTDEATELVSQDAFPAFQRFDARLSLPAHYSTAIFQKPSNLSAVLRHLHLDKGRSDRAWKMQPILQSNLSSGTSRQTRQNVTSESLWARALTLASCKLTEPALQPPAELETPLPAIEQATQVLYYLRPTYLQMKLVTHADESPGFEDRVIRVIRAVNAKTISAHLSASLLEEVEAVRRRCHKVLTASNEDSLDLAPIVIPSIRNGEDGRGWGNLWLDGYFRNPKISPSDQIKLGLERGGEITAVTNASDEKNEMMDEKDDEDSDLDYIFVVVEPAQLSAFINEFGVRSSGAASHPRSRIVWIVLPVNWALFGYAMTVAKLFAEAARFPLYWTVDDDLSHTEQFTRAGRWFQSSIRRTLLAGQAVLKLELGQCWRRFTFDSLSEWIEQTLSSAEPSPSFAQALAINRILWAMAEKDQAVLSRNPELIVEALATLPPLLVQHILQGLRRDCQLQSSRIASVSVEHAAGRRKGYLYRGIRGTHRESTERYQVVLHHTEGEKGHSMVNDDILFLEKPWHGMTRTEAKTSDCWTELNHWMKQRWTGGKGADKPFNAGLGAKGKYGYQMFVFVHHSAKFPEEAELPRGYGTSGESGDEKQEADEKEEEKQEARERREE